MYIDAKAYRIGRVDFVIEDAKSGWGQIYSILRRKQPTIALVTVRYENGSPEYYMVRTDTPFFTLLTSQAFTEMVTAFERLFNNGRCLTSDLYRIRGPRNQTVTQDVPLNL